MSNKKSINNDPLFVPVLQRPWAIQRVLLFSVGKTSAFSLEKVSRFSRVCSFWDETLWELGTKDFILPQNFIRDSFFTSQQIVNGGVAPTLQSLRQQGLRGAHQQQEFIASEAQEIMERTLLNERSIKYTKRIRKAFLFAGFDTKNLRNLPQFLRASTADIEYTSPTSTPVSTPTKTPHFEAIYCGGKQIVVYQARDLLSVPRAGLKFTDFKAFPRERKIPGYDTLSKDFATRLAAPTGFAPGGNPVSHLHSHPTISPDGRFMAYMFYIVNQRYISVWMIGNAKKEKRNDDAAASSSDHDNNGEYDSDEEFMELLDATIAAKNGSRKSKKPRTNRAPIKDDPDSASSVHHNHADKCVGWFPLTAPAPLPHQYYPIPVSHQQLTSVAFSKDSECLFYFDGLSASSGGGGSIRFLRYNSKSGKFEREQQHEKFFDCSKIHQPFLNHVSSADPNYEGRVVNHLKLIQPCHVPQTLNLHKIATAAADGIIGIWSVDTAAKTSTTTKTGNDTKSNGGVVLKPLLILRPKNSPGTEKNPPSVIHAAFFTFTRRLGAIYSDATMRIWDISAENSVSATSPLGSSSSPASAKSSSPGSSILIRHGVEIDGPIRLAPFTTDAITCAAISHYDDGYYCFSGNRSRSIQVVDLMTRARQKTLFSGQLVQSLAFPPHTSNLLIVANGAYRSIQVWNIEQGTVMKTVTSGEVFSAFALSFPSAGASGVMSCLSNRGSQQVFNISFFEKVAQLDVSEPLLRIIRLDGNKRQIDVEGLSGDEISLKF